MQYFNIPIMKYRTNECDVSECDENKRPLDKEDTTWFYLNLEIIERINENGVETEVGIQLLAVTLELFLLT